MTEIQRAMEAIVRASEATTDWQTQRRLLAAYDRLVIARAWAQSMRTKSNAVMRGATP